MSPQSDTFLMSDLTRTLRPQTQVNATVNEPIRHQSETELLQITLNRFSNITAANMGILVMPPRKKHPHYTASFMYLVMRFFYVLWAFINNNHCGAT